MANRPGQGRKPLPTRLKIVKGTDQPCRANPDEPMPSADKLEPPAGMGAAALAFWPSMVELLSDARILTNVDVPALAMLCEVYAQWTEATTRLNKHGLMVKGDKGLPVVSPYFNLADKLGKRLHALLSDFGMTPSSRTRVVATKALGDAAGSDPFADF